MRYKNLIYVLFLFLLQVVVYYSVFCYLFPFKEQLQIFQFTRQYAETTCQQAGGIALYIAEFLSQFYTVLWLGPVITAFLLTWVVALSSSILKKISLRDDLFFVSLLPWLSLLIMHLNYNYFEQGTIAYLFLLLSQWIYVSLKPHIRFIYAICMIPILYGIAGPVVHLFAITALLFEFLTNGKKKYASIIYLLVAVLSAGVGIYQGYSQSLTFAFSPEAYCNPLQKVSGIYYTWYALPVSMLLAAYLKRYKELVSLKGKCFWEGIQWGTVLLLTCWFIKHSEILDALESMKQDYFIRTERWDQVISDLNQNALSKRRMCELNLALAHKGILADRLFEYPQNGIETLMLRWDQTVFTAQLHSDLYYCMGIVSASQKFAFEALAASRPSGNPRMIKRLVETNMITGAYPVAEKYIRILENTWQYREWATSQRRYLNNDQAVEQDNVYGLKRRCWEAEKAIPGMYSNPVATLMHIVPACPANQVGLQYLTSFLLLNKDIEMYREFQEKVYRTPAWPDMSECQQEAIVICSPNDPRFWLEHGVSIKVRNKVAPFMQKVQGASRFGQNPPTALASEYGKTYWYYYMFNPAGK